MIFKTIVGFSKYEITENGVLRIKATGVYHKGSTNPKGYVNYRLLTDDGRRMTVGRHRLILMAFEPRDDMADLVANHKNGIKGDDRKDNLEWTTYTGNIEHAGMMGLTSKCKAIDIFYHKSKELIKFPSIIKASKYLNVTKDTLIWRLKFSDKEIWDDTWSIRYASDKEWSFADKPDRGTHEKVIYVRNIFSGEEEKFVNRSLFCKKYGYNLSVITQYFYKMNQPTLPGGIQIKSSLEPWETVDYYDSVSKLTGLKVVVMNDGVSDKFYYGLKECASDNNINLTTLHYKLKYRSGKPDQHGKSYRYYSKGPNI